MKNFMVLWAILVCGCQGTQPRQVADTTDEKDTIDTIETVARDTVGVEAPSEEPISFPEILPEEWPFDPPVRVDGERYANLEAALEQVSDHSQIELTSGIYSQRIVLEGVKDVRISSVGGPALFIVNELEESFIEFENCESIKVSDLFFSVDNYYDIPDDLGAIAINNCIDIQIERCALYHNAVGIYAQHSSNIYINKCVMQGMYSGVWLKACKEVTVRDCRFSCTVPIMGRAKEYELVSFDMSEEVADHEVLKKMQELDSVDLVLFKNWMASPPNAYDKESGIMTDLGYTVAAHGNVIIGDLPEAWSDWSASNEITNYESVFAKMGAKETYMLWWLSQMDEAFKSKPLNIFGNMVTTPNFSVDFLRQMAKDQGPDIVFPGLYFGSGGFLEGIHGQKRQAVGPDGLIETTLNLKRTGQFDHFGDTGSIFRLSTTDSAFFFLEPNYPLASSKIQSAQIASVDPSYRMVLGRADWGRVPFEDQIYRIVLGSDTSFLTIYSHRLLSCTVLKDRDGVRGLLNDFTELNGENDVYFGLKELIWAGELNADGKPDLIINVGDLCDNPFVLLTSGEKGYKPSYQRVLNFTPCGC